MLGMLKIEMKSLPMLVPYLSWQMLGMNVDTYTIEKLFLQLDPNFEGLRDLKEEYIQFNHTEYR